VKSHESGEDAESEGGLFVARDKAFADLSQQGLSERASETSEDGHVEDTRATNPHPGSGLANISEGLYAFTRVHRGIHA
jgi:hypothetical protein